MQIAVKRFACPQQKQSHKFYVTLHEVNTCLCVCLCTRKGRPAVQDDVSGLQLALIVKHHGVDPSYGVVLDHAERK